MCCDTQIGTNKHRVPVGVPMTDHRREGSRHRSFSAPAALSLPPAPAAPPANHVVPLPPVRFTVLWSPDNKGGGCLHLLPCLKSLDRSTLNRKRYTPTIRLRFPPFSSPFQSVLRFPSATLGPRQRPFTIYRDAKFKVVRSGTKDARRMTMHGTLKIKSRRGTARARARAFSFALPREYEITAGFTSRSPPDCVMLPVDRQRLISADIERAA